MTMEGSSVGLSTTAIVAGAALVPTAAPIVVTEGPTIPAGTPVGSFTDLGGPQPVAQLLAFSGALPRCDGTDRLDGHSER